MWEEPRLTARGCVLSCSAGELFMDHVSDPSHNYIVLHLVHKQRPVDGTGTHAQNIRTFETHL